MKKTVLFCLLTGWLHSLLLAPLLAGPPDAAKNQNPPVSSGNAVFRKASEKAAIFLSHVYDRTMKMDQAYSLFGARDTVKNALIIGDPRMLEDIPSTGLEFTEAWDIADKAMYSAVIKELKETKAYLEKEHQAEDVLSDNLDIAVQAWDELDQKIQKLFDRALRLAVKRAGLWQEQDVISDEFKNKMSWPLDKKYKGDRVKRANDVLEETNKKEAIVGKKLFEVHTALRRVFRQIEETVKSRPSFTTTVLKEAVAKKTPAGEKGALEQPELPLPENLLLTGQKPPAPEMEAAQKAMERACTRAREADSEAALAKTQADHAQKDMASSEKNLSACYEDKEQAKWDYEQAQESKPTEKSNARLDQLRHVYETAQDSYTKAKVKLMDDESRLAAAKAKMQKTRQQADEARQDCARRESALNKLKGS